MPITEPIRSAAAGSQPVAPTLPKVPQQWTSQALLAGGREAVIDHEGSLYRLRLTASGKLILTK